MSLSPISFTGFVTDRIIHTSLWTSNFALCREPGFLDAQWKDEGFPQERWRTL